MAQPELRSIANLIRQRQPDEARRALGHYLKAHPDSAEAWYLLSMVAAEAYERLRAAQKAAALDPANAKYGQQLARLLTTSPRTNRRLSLLMAVPLLLMLIAVGAVWAMQNISQPEITLPTQAALTLSERQPLTEGPPPTNIIVASDIPSPTSPPSATPEPVVLTSTIVSSAQPAASALPLTATPLITGQPSATSAALLSVPTNTPVSTNPVNPTLVPTNPPATDAPPTATANPTAVVPAVPTLVVVGAIPLREGANIGGGEVRIVDAFRRASAEIQARGGTVPPAPAGSEWVLVELLLVCDGDANCTPDTGAFNLMGTSGQRFPPAAGLRIEPAFGREVFAAGQVWGYLGFVVSSSESGLWLTLEQGAGIFRFALQ